MWFKGIREQHKLSLGMLFCVHVRLNVGVGVQRAYVAFCCSIKTDTDMLKLLACNTSCVICNFPRSLVFSNPESHHCRCVDATIEHVKMIPFEHCILNWLACGRNNCHVRLRRRNIILQCGIFLNHAHMLYSLFVVSAFECLQLLHAPNACVV